MDRMSLRSVAKTLMTLANSILASLDANPETPQPGDLAVVNEKPYRVLQCFGDLVSLESFTETGEFNFPVDSIKLYRMIR